MSFFAERLRTLRTELGLSMQALADQANVSKSMICKIERDEVQPTIDVAAKLSNALGKTLSEMLHVPHAAKVVFLAKEEQAVWEDAQQIKRRNISPVFEGLDIEWLQVTLPAHANVPNMGQLVGQKAEKCILVTHGVLQITIDDKVFQLKKGDSLYFDTCSHAFANPGDDTVEYYVVIRHKK